MDNNPCTDVLLDDAADYVARLVLQGVAPGRALDHGFQRFAVDRAVIRKRLTDRTDFPDGCSEENREHGLAALASIGNARVAELVRGS